MSSGVPKCSNLDPTLFLIIINDIANYISLADDEKQIKITNITSNTDAKQFQEDLNSLFQKVCKKNGV
jgi:hypothetical protein